MKEVVRALLGVRLVRRISRILAFGIGSGIFFMGAGNVRGYSAIDSALFGATGVVLGLIAALAFIYALKGFVSDPDFDTAMTNAVQQVESRVSQPTQEEEKK